MNLLPQPSTLVSSHTRQVAQAAFPHGSRYLQLRDTLGTLYDDALFDWLNEMPLAQTRQAAFERLIPPARA